MAAKFKFYYAELIKNQLTFKNVGFVLAWGSLAVSYISLG